MSEPVPVAQYRLRVERDEFAESPRKDMDNLGTMVCFHRAYDLGDKHSLCHDNFVGWDGIKEYLAAEEYAADFILPLYLLDHSGLAISTTPFGNRWDSRQVGFIYCAQATADKWFGEPVGEERILAALRAEVEAYDRWMQGDVWGYIVEEIKTCPTCSHVEYEQVDSCWGFYGEETAREEGRAVVASLLKKPEVTP